MMNDNSPLNVGRPFARRADYLPELARKITVTEGESYRYLMSAHLFDDTMRMIDALAGVMDFDAIIGIPYSSGNEVTRTKWQNRYGERVKCPETEASFKRTLFKELTASLSKCIENDQKLIVQEVGGYVVELLHEKFSDRLEYVAGVVEITKQGVWRASELDLKIPILHCADSELKRFEAKRCGETIARCLDGLFRELGNSLAGRHAAVFGAGWIGMGVAEGLRRLDVVTSLIDTDPLKVTEARLLGFNALKSDGAVDQSSTDIIQQISKCDLIVGAAGRQSINRDVLQWLRDGCLVASGSSRQLEIDVTYLQECTSYPIHESIRAYEVQHEFLSGNSQICLVNDGFPVNFIPGSGSVADEIVELILGELIVLMAELTEKEFSPGIHRMDAQSEKVCAELWLKQRDNR